MLGFPVPLTKCRASPQQAGGSNDDVQVYVTASLSLLALPLQELSLSSLASLLTKQSKLGYATMQLCSHMVVGVDLGPLLTLGNSSTLSLGHRGGLYSLHPSN